MKKIWAHIWILPLMFLTLPAGAQSRANVEVISPKAEIRGGHITIDLTLEVKGVDIKTTEEYVIDFVLQGSGKQWFLPEVIYSGKQRHFLESRKEFFSERETRAPYQVYNKARKEEVYRLDYKLSMPYEQWMEHASLYYWERLAGCDETLIESKLLIEDLNPVEEVKPLVWEPSPEVYNRMLYFKAPEAEKVKQRTIVLDIRLDYPDNGTGTNPLYGSNTRKLEEANSQLRPLFDNGFITVDSIRLTGYDSPEGSVRTNQARVKQRTESLKDYFTGIYGLPVEKARISWVPEDWNELGKAIAESGIAHKQDVLSVIRDQALDSEAKKRILKTMANGVVWEEMKNQCFPGLQKIKVNIDYTISGLTDKELCELIFVQPELFSAEEMFRTAFLFEAGSREYLKAFEMALEYYPEEDAVWYNAAAAYLSVGDVDNAVRLLKKTKETPEAMINLGVYYYIAGDVKKAEQCFALAGKAGINKGLENLQLLND